MKLIPQYYAFLAVVHAGMAENQAETINQMSNSVFSTRPCVKHKATTSSSMPTASS